MEGIRLIHALSMIRSSEYICLISVQSTAVKIQIFFVNCAFTSDVILINEPYVDQGLPLLTVFVRDNNQCFVTLSHSKGHVLTRTP